MLDLKKIKIFGWMILFAAGCSNQATPTATVILPSPTLAAPTATPTTQLIAIPSPTATRVPPTLAPATLPPTRAPTTVPPPTVATVAHQTFSALTIQSPPTDRPAAQHADLNFTLRGFVAAKFALRLQDLEGATDGTAPQLSSLFADSRDPAIKAVYRVYDWKWDCNCRGNAIDDPEISLIGLVAKPGEVIRVPHANYAIGNGFQVLVLYADADSITLGYTRNDNVTKGYVVHIEGITVLPDLVAYYQQMNTAGRASLPALRSLQTVGNARTDEIKVAVRDSGAFMDPRSRKDWWRDKPKIVKPGLESK